MTQDRLKVSISMGETAIDTERLRSVAEGDGAAA